jgi:hypothetical protein
MLRIATLTAACALLPLTAAGQDGAPPAKAEAERLETIGRDIFEALNRAREAEKVPRITFSSRLYVALQDHLNKMVSLGYKGGPVKVKKGLLGSGKKYPKLGESAKLRHGWSISLLDNYSNGKKDGMDPDTIIKVLRAHPSIKSLLRKDLNSGASAAAPVPGTDDYVIVVGLGSVPKSKRKNVDKVDAAYTAWKDADAAKRKKIAKGLAGLRDPEALPLLTRAVEDDDLEVRKVGVKAVKGFKDPWAIPALISQLGRESDDKLKKDIHKALQSISGKKEYDDNPKRWSSWWDVERNTFKKGGAR